MGTTQPIRDSRQLSQFINYYATTQPNQRNYTLIVIGLHTALRISDILTLQWKNVFDFKTTKCRTHLQIIEHKTGKKSKIALCPESQKALSDFYIMKIMCFLQKASKTNHSAVRRHIALYGQPQKNPFTKNISVATHCARLLAIMPGNKESNRHY